MRVRRRIRLAIAAVTITSIGAVATDAGPASAGAPGQNPAACSSPTTWRYKDFNVNGDTLRLELRHSNSCGVVGWARLTQIAGTSAVSVTLSAWNPSKPSQYTVPKTNYTYTVNARTGQQVCGGFQAYSIDGLGNRHYINWFFGGCYYG